MPEYRCECCNYSTSRKSNLDNHNASKKHLEKINRSEVNSVVSDKSVNIETIYSQNTTVSEESYLTLKIRELENALKLKDLEIKLKDEQIEMLKNTIQVLSSNTKPTMDEQPKLFSQKITKPKPKTTENISIEIKELNHVENALDIETFLENIKAANETELTQKVEYFGKKTNLLKPNVLQYITKDTDMNDMAWKLVNGELKKLKENQRPLQLINQRLHKFKVKSNGVWYDPNKDEDVVNNIMEKFFKTICNLIESCYFSVRIPVKFSEGRTETDDANKKDEEEDQSLIDKIRAKKHFKEELTSYEQNVYNKIVGRDKRLEQFKNYSKIRNVDTFFDHTHGHFCEAINDAKFSKFIIKLANDGKGTTNEKHNVKEIQHEEEEDSEDEETEDEEDE